MQKIMNNRKVKIYTLCSIVGILIIMFGESLFQQNIKYNASDNRQKLIKLSSVNFLSNQKLRFIINKG